MENNSIIKAWKENGDDDRKEFIEYMIMCYNELVCSRVRSKKKCLLLKMEGSNVRQS